MKRSLLILLCALALGAAIISLPAQQKPGHVNGAEHTARDPDTPALAERVRSLETLTRQQTKAIGALAEDSKKLAREVNELRAELDDLKKKVK